LLLFHTYSHIIFFKKIPFIKDNGIKVKDMAMANKFGRISPQLTDNNMKVTGPMTNKKVLDD